LIKRNISNFKSIINIEILEVRRTFKHILRTFL